MASNAGRAAALKAWETRRANEKAFLEKCRQAALKAWETRRKSGKETPEKNRVRAIKAWETRRKNEAQALYERLTLGEGFSKWHALEASGLLTKKATYRAQVVDFILEHAPITNKRFAMVSLPGSRWEAERAIVDRLPTDVQIEFTGAEFNGKFFHHPVVKENHRQFMPGNRIRFIRDEDGDESVETRGRVNSCLYQIGLADLTIFQSLNLSAAWLDMMTNVEASSVLGAIKALALHIPEGRRIPVVVTVAAGREPRNRDGYKRTRSYREGNPTGARAERLAQLFNEAGLSASEVKFEHVKSDVPGMRRGMVNVFLLVTR